MGYGKESSINDVMSLGGRGHLFCNDSNKDLELKSVTMARGVKMCSN